MSFPYELISNNEIVLLLLILFRMKNYFSEIYIFELIHVEVKYDKKNNFLIEKA